MIKSKTISWSLVLFFILALLAAMGRLMSSFSEFTFQVLYICAPLLAVFAGVSTVPVYGLNNKHGKAIFLITLGILALFIGEFIWTIFDYVLGIDPYPSIADCFYLLSYPLFLSGLIVALKGNKGGVDALPKLTKFLLVTLLTLLIAAVSYEVLFLQFDSTLTFVENVVGMAYGIGDLLLIIVSYFVVKMASQYRGGKMLMPWMMIFIGLVLTLIADIYFNIYNEAYTAKIAPYIHIDLLWIASYLFYTFGIFSLGIIVKTAIAKISNKNIL